MWILNIWSAHFDVKNALAEAANPSMPPKAVPAGQVSTRESPYTRQQAGADESDDSHGRRRC